jgi:hypothetical protein
MKKLLLILFCLPLLIMAQAPQGFTYQGVATDNNGFELQNQNIAIKASILSATATGTTVWQETHTTTTDTFGLFNVTIGEGTSTNGGSSATFQEIDWGAASHFMKVEIDVNGGSNYVHVGTSQMMSVPYALYAENANNINMDSISNYLLQDSIFLANIGEKIVPKILPDFLKDVGNGTNDFYSDIQTTLVTGEYDDLFIYNGDVVGILPNQTTVIYVKDTCKISGTINGNGGNAQGSASNGSGSVHFMANGGSSGGGYTGGYAQIDNCNTSSETGSITLSINDYFPINALGASINASFGNLSDAVHVFPFLHGGDGGTSYYWSGGNIYCGRPGGQGGAGLYIICNTLIFDGEIQLSGGNGTSCYQTQYGYHATGGGGSGSVVISSDNIINQTGTIIQNAGIGGGCANTNPYAMTPAGDGGIGTSYIVEF